MKSEQSATTSISQILSLSLLGEAQSRGWASWAADHDSHQTLLASPPDRPHLPQKQADHRFLMPELVFISGVKIAKERMYTLPPRWSGGRAGTEAQIGS